IETIGGRSIGFFAKKGRLSAVIMISNKCSAEDIIILFVTKITFLYMAPKLKLLS